MLPARSSRVFSNSVVGSVGIPCAGAACSVSNLRPSPLPSSQSEKLRLRLWPMSDSAIPPRAATTAKYHSTSPSSSMTWLVTEIRRSIALLLLTTLSRLPASPNKPSKGNGARRPASYRPARRVFDMHPASIRSATWPWDTALRCARRTVQGVLEVEWRGRQPHDRETGRDERGRSGG